MRALRQLLVVLVTVGGLFCGDGCASWAAGCLNTQAERHWDGRAAAAGACRYETRGGSVARMRVCLQQGVAETPQPGARFDSLALQVGDLCCSTSRHGVGWCSRIGMAGRRHERGV